MHKKKAEQEDLGVTCTCYFEQFTYKGGKQIAEVRMCRKLKTNNSLVTNKQEE